MNNLLIIEAIQLMFKTVAKVFTSNDKKEKELLRFISFLLLLVFATTVALSIFGSNKVVNNILTALIVIFVILIIIIILVLNVIQTEKEKNIVDQKIDKAEATLESNPNETNAAWNVAKLKIEKYIDKNISQINSIYNISISIIGIGFLIIIAGIIAIYIGRDNTGSIVIIISGLLTNFIGSTILIIQRNVFIQAKEYLTALERINAVGMCVQIVDLIEEKVETTKRDDAKANIAKQILSMYSEKK